MKSKTLYPGIASGSYGERAIDIVADEQSISGPALFARLGISTYEASALKRAVQLGYLSKARSTEPGKSGINIYTPGPNLPAGTAGRSMVRALLEYIAEHAPITSLALADAFDTDAGLVSSRLSTVVHSGCVRMRLVDSQGLSMRKLICEYFDANVVRYLENHARTGHRRETAAAPKDAANLVPSRTPPEFRPLNLARLNNMPQREGAWDFREIPSHYSTNQPENPCA